MFKTHLVGRSVAEHMHWLQELAFFGLEDRCKELLGWIEITHKVSASQAYYIGRTYKSDRFMQRAARLYIEEAPKSGLLSDEMATHLGPQLRDLAKECTVLRRDAEKKLIAIREAINVFSGSIRPDTTCDYEECPRNCTGDSEDHPVRDLEAAESDDYTAEPFEVVSKIFRVLYRE